MVIQRKNYHHEIVLLASVVTATALFHAGAFLGFYRLGLTLFNDEVTGAFTVLLPFVYLAFIVVLLIRGVFKVIMCGIRCEIRHLCQQMFFVALSILIVISGFIIGEPGSKYTTKGVFKTMKQRADILSIQKWLGSEQAMVGVDKDGILNESRWPDAINDLSPRLVVIKRTVSGEKYARLVWGGGMIGFYGLTIGAASDEIPLNDFCMSEYRLGLASNAFVWGELKKPVPCPLILYHLL